MPIVQMYMVEGRTPEQKRHVAESVTRSIVESLGVPETAVRIMICELGRDDFFVAGKASKGALEEATISLNGDYPESVGPAQQVRG